MPTKNISRTDLFITDTQTMYDLFIEMTNLLFWEGYAEQLAVENPEAFRQQLNDFLKAHNP